MFIFDMNDGGVNNFQSYLIASTILGKEYDYRVLWVRGEDVSVFSPRDLCHRQYADIMGHVAGLYEYIAGSIAYMARNVARPHIVGKCCSFTSPLTNSMA